MAIMLYGKCSICGKDTSYVESSASVGRYRPILCNRCQLIEGCKTDSAVNLGKKDMKKIEEQVKGRTDLGFHDDVLLSFELNMEQMTASLTIKTFTWNPIPPTENGKVVLCAKPNDALVKIHMKLDDNASGKVFSGDWHPIIPDTILWAYVDKGLLSLVMIDGYLDFRIKSYRREEQR